MSEVGVYFGSILSLTSRSIFVAARAAMASFYTVRKETYTELPLGVELADLLGDVGQLFPRSLLSDNPRMGQDHIPVEPFGGVDHEDFTDEVLGHI